MDNSFLFGFVIMCLSFLSIMLSIKIRVLRGDISAIRDEMARLQINDRLQKKRITTQLESFMRLISENSKLKAQVQAMQKEIDSLSKLINN